jgi:hypothetical protein
MPKNYALQFLLKGVPLQARRIETSVAPATKWATETFAVNFPAEPGVSIDQIQIFYDANDDTWRHWPTKFIEGHKDLGNAVAKARNDTPELRDYKVRCDLHKYSDLSDKPTIRFLPSQGSNPSDAVYRLREKIEEERSHNYNCAELVLRSGSKRYIGSIYLSGVAEG